MKTKEPHQLQSAASDLETALRNKRRFDFIMESTYNHIYKVIIEFGSNYEYETFDINIDNYADSLMKMVRTSVQLDVSEAKIKIKELL